MIVIVVRTRRQYPAWLDITGLVITVAAGGTAQVVWPRSPGWNEAHRIAVTSGLLLTYAWYGIAQPALATIVHD